MATLTFSIWLFVQLTNCSNFLDCEKLQKKWRWFDFDSCLWNNKSKLWLELSTYISQLCPNSTSCTGCSVWKCVIWKERISGEMKNLYSSTFCFVLEHPVLMHAENTVRKFYHFSITAILREIKFGDSRNAKSAILTHSEALVWIMILWIIALFEGWNLPNQSFSEPQKLLKLYF